MSTQLSQPALQEQTLRIYGELTVIRQEWAGKLVIGVGAGCASGGFPAACSLVGAACLLLEPSAAEAKAVLRDGGIDFLVSTVDEALRTLKNEVRKGRPLAVVVAGNWDAALEELSERGVAPDLLFRTTTLDSARQSTAFTGVRLLEARSISQTEEFADFLNSQGLEASTWALPGRAAVRAFDRALLEVIGGEDVVRRRWIEGITRYQRSAEQDYRSCWVSEAEMDQIADIWMGQAL